MNSIESEVSRVFYEADVCVNCDKRSRDIYQAPFGPQMHGLTVHKMDLAFVLSQLARYDIEFLIHPGEFMDERGRWTHKNDVFIELPNHLEAYETLAMEGIL